MCLIDWFEEIRTLGLLPIPNMNSLQHDEDEMDINISLYDSNRIDEQSLPKQNLNYESDKQPLLNDTLGHDSNSTFLSYELRDPKSNTKPLPEEAFYQKLMSYEGEDYKEFDRYSDDKQDEDDTQNVIVSYETKQEMQNVSIISHEKEGGFVNNTHSEDTQNSVSTNTCFDSDEIHEEVTYTMSSKDEAQEEVPQIKYKREPMAFEGWWALCDNCDHMNYVRFMTHRICEECRYHLQMNSTERIDLLIDSGSWKPMNQDMISCDILEFVDEQPYNERLEEYQDYTGLTDAVQTGTGSLNGRLVALGVMDFQFIGGSMGSVVGEKLTRLIEHATQYRLPVIIVCASGGARMQEGSVSLMQMAKIASVLHIHQIEQRLIYICILTYPTTGGVTASFGMLGDIIISEPRALIAFAGKRIIEEILKIEVPDGVQVAEALFKHGMLDLIINRSLLKGSLMELFEFYESAASKSVNTFVSSDTLFFDI